MPCHRLEVGDTEEKDRASARRSSQSNGDLGQVGTSQLLLAPMMQQQNALPHPVGSLLYHAAKGQEVSVE